MHSAGERHERKIAPLRWLGRLTGVTLLVASAGLLAAGQVGASVTNITVSVLSDTTPQHHVEGVAYDGTNGNAQIPIATFTDSDACPTPTTCQLNTDYTATIQWGGPADTSSCPANCTISAPTFVSGTTASYGITASHAFKDEFNCMPAPCQNDPVTVTVNDTADVMTATSDNFSVPNTCNPGGNSACNGIAVKDQALTGIPASFTATSGVLFTKQIGSFHDANPLASTTDANGTTKEYSILTINWGDGSALDNTGTLSLGACDTSGCQLNVSGTHTYANSNVYPVKITVQDGLDFQFKITFTSTATVSDDGGTRCASADLLGSSSRMPAGSSINFTAGAGGCSSPLYQFWLRYGSGSWMVTQSYSPTKTWTWNTSSSGLGSYTIVVWVKQSGSTASYETFAATNVTLFGCVGTVSDVPNPSSPQLSGTTVHLTASNNSGCPNPIYQFWLQAPGSTVWTIVQPYSANTNLFNWDTAGRVAGIYRISVWVRQANSIGAHMSSFGHWDSYVVINYTLTTATCGSVNITSAPPATAEVGPSIPITANAPCPFPLYQFWLRYAGGSWKVMQKFSTVSTWPWSTVQALPGSYDIVVWVKQSGASTATHYQSSAAANVVLTGCVGNAGDVANPPSPQASGTAVQFTASNDSGCTNARYQFWVQAPGSTTWTLVQAYSANTNVYAWTTTGKPAGVYKISVWVRDLDSGGAFGNSFGRYDAFTVVNYTLT